MATPTNDYLKSVNTQWDSTLETRGPGSAFTVSLELYLPEGSQDIETVLKDLIEGNPPPSMFAFRVNDITQK
jgi:hypothetical protein